MDSVELHPAFIWDCNECGRENLTRTVLGDFDQETLHDMREQHGITEYESGDWYTAPTTVRCRYCGGTFSTSNDEDDQD